MSDIQNFFANKNKTKTKKKVFKFNANLIDAATVTSAVHVDAPALSTETDVTGPLGSIMGTTESGITSGTMIHNTNGAAAAGADGGKLASTSGAGAEEWDDEALAASFSRNKGTPAVIVAATSGVTAELLDMKALDAKRRGEDDIAERLRIEETKAQLAAAKEGMEREAQRLKEEREMKERNEDKKTAPVGNSFSGAAGGKWVPPHMRAGSTGLDHGRMGFSSGMPSSKLDTQDDNLFPDLAAADAILEQKKEQVAYKVVKKTPVGGPNTTWGSAAATKGSAGRNLPESEPQQKRSYHNQR